MASIVVKVDRNGKDYVIWNTVIDRFTFVGDREEVVAVLVEESMSRRGLTCMTTASACTSHCEYLSILRKRIERLVVQADADGSSWPELLGAWDEPLHPWHPGQATVPRDELAHHLESLEELDQSEISSMFVEGCR